MNVEFRQARSLRHKENHLARWEVYIEGKHWGFFHRHAGGLYYLHFGTIAFQYAQAYSWGDFAKAGEDACASYGVPFKGHTITKEA
jgi:hypothetical protein